MFHNFFGSRKLLCALVLAAVVLLPLALDNDYLIRIAVVSGMYIILTLGLNLVTGYTGQFCLGWAAFYGIGAYTSALLTLKLQWSFWLGLPMGGLAAAIFGVLLGIPTMRLRDIYLAITTLGFGEIIRLILLNWTDLTRGAMGLPGIPAPSLLGVSLDNKYFYYYFIVFLALLAAAAMMRIVDSRLGRALIAIREDELAAKSMGIDTTRYKITAFAIGAFYAGVAGGYYAHYTSFIDPHTFSFGESVIVLAMVVLGGMGSIAGSVFGAVVLTILPELLREIAEYRMIVYGLLMMAVMLVRPQGLFGQSQDGSMAIFRKRRQGGGERGVVGG